MRSTIRAYWTAWTAVGVWFDRLDRYDRPPIVSSCSVALERLGDGHDVDRLAALEQVEHRRVDRAVGLPVEVLRAQELGDLDDRVPVDQDRAEHGLLGLEALRRQSVDHSATPHDCGTAVTAWAVTVGRRGRPSLVVRGGDPMRSTNTRGRTVCRPRRRALVDRIVDGVWTDRRAGCATGAAPQSRRRMTPMSLPWIRTSS